MNFRNPEKIKEEIDRLRKEQVRIENLMGKQETNGVFDNSLYDEVDELDDQIYELELELEKYF